LQGYTPERLIAPHSIPAEEQRSQSAGEALIDNLLEKADAAVVISESDSEHSYIVLGLN
jgi:hypothetical protein